MASLIDLSSSPDPLGDDAPSSLRPLTRRTAGQLKSHPRESSLQLPSSIARARPLSTSKSPRKQMFELDVGNDRSPQRLLVTVEAEDDRGRRSGVSRRLFTASPTRSVSRRRETATTTTVVPLRGLTDDETGGLGDDPTPRRRGRPRGSLGSKNGTPAPRGKKRAGTPLRKASPAKRRGGGEAPSEMTLPSDALLETSANVVDEPTPKPKTKTRKTPKKASTPAIPSSNATGRKRGRPRKALIPDEMAVMAKEVESRTEDATMVPSEDAPVRDEPPSEDTVRLDKNTTALKAAMPPILEDTTQGFSGRRDQRRSLDMSLSPDRVEEPSTHEARTGDLYESMFDDFAGEPHSDLDSEVDEADGITYSGQDNLTHASEFSMIAVEELPSFQASFRSNRSGVIEEDHRFADAGDETNLIINQTLESLRRSTQSEAQDTSNLVDIHKELEHPLPAEEQDPLEETRNSPSKFGSSQLSWTRSPRRQQKALPLSRQVFSNRAPHVDDSFSSIPDSILQAATPGRLPMKQSAHIADDSNMYEDSFSEVPDEVLTAATPRPSRTATHLGQEDHMNFPSSEEEVQSATRSTNFRSDRLPTPDDTNSSTTDAKNGPGDDTHRMVVDSSAAVNTSDLNIRSSPPTISRKFNTMNIQSESAITVSRHFDTMALQSEITQPDQNMTDTLLHKSSPPQVPLVESNEPGQSQTLHPPASSRRPTLSPIVRAGRTLQNIMSDRSSPDDLGSSLGSPFRGSVQNDSRQSSVARSPARGTAHRRTGSDSRTHFNPIASLSQSIRSAFGSTQRAAPAPVPAPALASAPVPAPVLAPATDVAPLVRESENLFGSDIHDHSQAEVLGRSAYGMEDSHLTTQPRGVDFVPEVPSSTGIAPLSEKSLGSWADQHDDPSSPATQRSRRISVLNRSANTSVLYPRGTHSSRLNEIEDEEEEEDEEDRAEEQETHEDEQEHSEEGYRVEDEQRTHDGDEQVNDQAEEQDAHHDDVRAEQEHAGEEQELRDEDGQEDNQFEQEQTLDAKQQEDESAEISYETEDDDMDLWDIEASRATPRSTKVLRVETQEPRRSQTPIKATTLAPVSIPDQAAAPVAAGANPPRRTKIPSPWRRNARRLIYQDDFRSPSEIDMEDSPPSDVGRAVSVSQAAVQKETVIEQSPMPSQEEMDEVEEEEEDINIAPEQDEDEPEYGSAHDLMEYEESNVPEAEGSYASEQEKSDAPLIEHSPLHDYSMVSHYENPTEVTQDSHEKPAPARKSFFGKFDVLSFFSSPRPPPTNNNPPKAQIDETPVHQTAAKPLPRSVQSVAKSLNDEPQSALRATGLFPPIRQKLFNPSPDRRVDLFSPGTALRSNDTVADTYAETPSTPERHDFPSIPQKRNFTPLSAQSRNTASLFTPSHQGSTPAQDVRTPSPEYDDLRDPDSSSREESMLADGPSFEHIPPREKPSQWDKTLSPIKSCLRSPIKPKTPGRVVQFTSSVLSPDAQEQARTDRQRALSTLSNNGGVNIATSNPRTAILNPTPLRVSMSYQIHDNDKENTPSPPKSTGRRVSQSAQKAHRQTILPSKLSPTTWSRAHWVRLDEILQLRKKDPMQFQMLFPSVAPGKHPLSGLEVAAHDAKLVLEDWHLEVVEAFRSELSATPRSLVERGEAEKGWDARSLSKRLFALMVGEERRRSGKYVSGQSRKAGVAKGNGRGAAAS